MPTNKNFFKRGGLNSGRGGRGFKSRCSDQKKQTHFCVSAFLFGAEQRDLNRAAARSAASNQPCGLLLSPRVPTRRNVYRGDCYYTFVYWSFLSSQRDLQRRRPLPAAETGRSCWGSVLIFQSPAKGLWKNQQTQPGTGRRFEATAGVSELLFSRLGSQRKTASAIKTVCFTE